VNFGFYGRRNKEFPYVFLSVIQDNALQKHRSIDRWIRSKQKSPFPKCTAVHVFVIAARSIIFRISTFYEAFRVIRVAEGRADPVDALAHAQVLGDRHDARRVVAEERDDESLPSKTRAFLKEALEE